MSGIGPAAHLKQHGIAVVHDSPGVGRNLQEHPTASLEWNATQPVTFLSELRWDKLALSALRWAVLGTGTATYQVNSCNVVIKTRPELERPDMQIMVNPIRFDAQTWFPGLKKRQQDVWWAGIVQLHPESRGWVELKSADPREVAAVTLNILDTENDRKQLRDAIRLTRKIYRTDPMGELVGEEKTPGEQVQSDAELDAYLRDWCYVGPAPGRHLRDGPRHDVGGRQRAEGDRRRGPARGRCLGDADGAGRQYDAALDHGRREGGRPDPRAEPAARRASAEGRTGKEACAAQEGGMSRTPEEEANLALVLAMFEHVLNPMDSGAVDRFISPDYIQHNQMAEPGREGLKKFLDMIKAQTPEAVHDVKRAFVDGDHVTVHYHVRRWPGDNGWAVIDIFRLENGLIAEHWDVMQDVVPGGPNPLGPF